MRWVPGIRDQRAWLFIPDDLRLRIRAAEIAEQRRHSLRTARRDDEDARSAQGPDDVPMTGDQLSLFAALSAVAPATGTRPRRGTSRSPTTGPTGPTTGSRSSSARRRPSRRWSRTATPGMTRRQAKDRLRLANAEAAKDIARVSGLSYAAVNLELNRSAGLRRVTEATETQLQARLHAARRWQWRLGR